MDTFDSLSEWLIPLFKDTRTIFLVVATFTLYTSSWLLEKYKYPPGPIPLPFIGNSLALFAKYRAKYRYDKWRKYGNVVSNVILGTWRVELFGFDTIYEAFVKHADNFSERSTFSPNFAKYMKPGLMAGEQWRDLRKQAMVVLRDHGMGKSKIEGKIREELEYTMEVFSAMRAVQSSDTIKTTLGMTVANIINQVVFGHRLDYDDKDFNSLCQFDAFFMTFSKSSLFPFYKYWPWDPLNFEPAAENFKRAKAFFSSEIQLHKPVLDVDQPKDYIDAYLVEGMKSENPIFRDEEVLLASMIQLYVGGFDTTSTTLTWAILYMMNYPDVQQKLYDEIQHTIGSRPVSLSDKDTMHFTQSFIHETLRASGIVSSSLPHLCTADTLIQGSVIPKGTRVIANLYSTFHDEEVFPDSYTFKADRFLNTDGEFSKPTGKQMLAFSVGRRACLGESLARAELFMILVSFVQRFEVHRVTEELVPDGGMDVFTHTPEPFQVTLKPRL